MPDLTAAVLAALPPALPGPAARARMAGTALGHPMLAGVALVAGLARRGSHRRSARAGARGRVVV